MSKSPKSVFPGMQYRYYIIYVVLPLAVLLAACNDDTTASRYDEILSQPAFAAITDSIQKEPGRADLYFRRAILLNQNNYPEPSLEDFKKAWSLNNKEEYAIGASNLLLSKNREEAIDFMQEVLMKIPNSILLRLTLAHAYDEQGKTDDALAVCQSILQQHPEHISTLVLQSELLQKKNDEAAAIIALEKARQLIPADLDINFKLAYLYAETKNSKAIALADSLIAKDSLRLYPQPYYIKGMYYTNTSENDKAIQAFNETIRTDYNNLNAYLEKGKILLEQKKITEAFKTFQLANTISPAFPDAYYWMGKCQEAQGNKAEAKLSYEKAYGLDKTFTEAKEAADKLK